MVTTVFENRKLSKIFMREEVRWSWGTGIWWYELNGLALSNEHWVTWETPDETERDKQRQQLTK